MQTIFPHLISPSSQKILQKVSLQVAGLLVTMLLGACSTTLDKMERLNQTLRGYEKAIRWAKYDMAYSFHKWEADEQPTLPTHLKNIRVTSYQVINQSFDEETMTAKLTVSIQYYNQDDLRERSIQDQQRWKFFPDLKRWYLISEPIDFK